MLLIWSLIPIYNMLLIALDPDEGETEFAWLIWPPEPSLQSFRVVLVEGYWYLEHFWNKFANSLFIALMTMLLTLVIGSLASFALGRTRFWCRETALAWRIQLVLTYGAIPASFLVIPFYRDDAACSGLSRQSLVGHIRRRDLRHSLRDPDPCSNTS